MPRGDWLKLHRKIMDSKVWFYTHAQFRVWLTILLSVNWKEGWSRHRGEEIKLEPGQMTTSREHLVEESGASKKVVRDTLSKLEKDGMIETDRSSGGTLLTVCHWDKYQSNSDGGSGRSSDEGNSEGNNGGSDGGTQEEGEEGEEQNNKKPGPTDPDEFSEKRLRDEFGNKAVNFTNRFIEKNEEINPRRSTPDKGTELYRKWVRAFDRLHRIGPSGGTEGETGYKWAELKEILRYAFNHEGNGFSWKNQVRSPVQLRQRNSPDEDPKIVKIEDSMQTTNRGQSDFSDEWEDAV